MKKLQTLTLSIVFLLAACDGAVVEAPAPSNDALTIVSPADGATYLPGELVDIETKVSLADGGDTFFLIIADQPSRQDQVSNPLIRGTIIQPWTPNEAGSYSVKVVALTTNGVSHESNTITVNIGGVVVAQEEPSATLAPAQDTPTPTLTHTPTLSPAAFTADKDTNCRVGPSSAVFDIRKTIFGNQTVPIVGVGAAPYEVWWVVEVDGQNCWVWSELGVPSGDYLNVPVISSPPFPTATFTPTATDVPVALSAPSPSSPSGSLNCAAVTGGTTLQWSGVNHPSGIDYYEWELTGALNESGNTGGTSASTSGLFCAGANYQWRVRAVDGNGNIGPWSAFMAFDVP